MRRQRTVESSATGKKPRSDQDQQLCGQGYHHRDASKDRPTPSQADAYRMIRRRALAAGIATKIGNHSFRATGITEYLKNGGKLEVAQAMANHESARTTGLYDRRSDQVNLDEVERIVI